MEAAGVVAGSSIEWEEHAGSRVVVYAAPGSLAVSAAATELRDADRSVETLEALFGPAGDPDRTPVRIFLVDPLAEMQVGGATVTSREEAIPSAPPPGAVGETAIVRTVAAEGAEPVAAPLARLLVRRWYGPAAATAEPFVSGISGVVAARVGTGPSLEEAHEWVASELAAGRAVSVLASYGNGAPRPFGLAATSFVGFLIEKEGPESVGRLLACYDPDRRDEAVVAVYQKPLAALSESWLAKVRKREQRPSIRPVLAYLLSLLSPHRRRYAELFGYQVLLAALALRVPLVSGYVVRSLQEDTLTRAELGAVVGLMLIAHLSNSAITLRMAYVESDLFQRIGTGLQERMFDHLQRLPHAFHSDAQVGDVAARLTSDTQTVQRSMNQLFAGASFLALTALTATVTVILTNYLVGLLILGIIPLLVVAHRVFGERMSQGYAEAAALTGGAMATAQESLQAHAVIKAFGLERPALTSFGHRLGNIRRVHRRLSLIQELFQSGVTMATNLAEIVVLGIGGYLVIIGTIPDAGSLVTLLLLLPRALGPVTALAFAQQHLRAAGASVERVREVLDHPIGIEDLPGAATLTPLAKEVRFESVWFGYEADAPILRGLDLVIPAGANVAVVGPSGSGKSTLVNLMLRFWDPEQGRVLIDGHDLRDVTLESLRSQIALVFQETFIFNTTVRDNIGIGRSGASDAEIEAAARAARLHDWVESLAAAYDTVLGERGLRMSGGQRQRLAIARALLRDPTILVLDEPTSALDARTESEILDTLASVVGGRTTITITHRLAMARAADVIVVLDQGQVIEQGPHEDLVNAGGLYQRLHEEQTGQLDVGASGRIGLEAARLRKVPLFSRLDMETLTSLAEHLTAERFQPGDDIVRQGEEGDKLYVVGHGAADVLVTAGGAERRVSRVKEGDYFGELALLTGRPRSATVRATTPMETYSLARDIFLDLVQEESSLRDRLSQLVFARRAAYDAAALAAGIRTAEKAEANDSAVAGGGTARPDRRDVGSPTASQ